MSFVQCRPCVMLNVSSLNKRLTVRYTEETQICALTTVIISKVTNAIKMENSLLIGQLRLRAQTCSNHINSLDKQSFKSPYSCAAAHA